MSQLHVKTCFSFIHLFCVKGKSTELYFCNSDAFKLSYICMLRAWDKEFQLWYASQTTSLLPVFFFCPSAHRQIICVDLSLYMSKKVWADMRNNHILFGDSWGKWEGLLAFWWRFVARGSTPFLYTFFFQNNNKKKKKKKSLCDISLWTSIVLWSHE